jgi:transposase
MYLKSRVKIPDVHGKMTRLRRGDVTYIKYEYDRYYDPEKKYTYPQRATIGKLCVDDDTMMIPNEAFLKYFPDVVLSGMEDRADRSGCLRIGTYAVIHKIIRDYTLDEMLGRFFTKKELALLFDLAAYSIVEESNVAQHYPDYAYNHPLHSPCMKIYSDATVSDFFKGITKDKSTGFLNEWNAKRNRRERIYISYDSTNKNCQAGDIELAEFGHAKTDIGSAIINYSVGYDLKNKEPLFYEAYPGSINDVSQLRVMLGKITGYGYKKIGFILDRGYFSRGNIRYLDECGYSFVIMAKGMASFVSELILENRGTFENKRACDMNAYGVYGKTVQRTLFEGDEKMRYIHIYHSISKEADERESFENALRERTALLMSHQNETVEFGTAYERYFYLHYDENGVFLYPEEKTTVTEREISLCGYFVIITSDRMTAKEALHLYKSRDASEKLFASDKSFLGNKSIRSHTNEGIEGRIFTQFIALIIRNKIYTSLQESGEQFEKKQNYMTVPAAIKELEKIEMSRQTDNIYRLDHAVTAKQKKILKVFGMNEGSIIYQAGEISNTLRDASLRKERG